MQNRVGSKFHFHWNDKESGVQFLNCDLKSKTLLNSVTFFFLEKNQKQSEKANEPGDDSNDDYDDCD